MNNYEFKRPNKKLILSVLSSSTFITGFTLTVIWLYLSNLDRLDVLYDSTSASSAIAVIFGFTILSVLGFSILIFSSSFILILIFSSYEKELTIYNGMPHNFSITGLFNSLGLFAILPASFFSYYYFELNGYLVTSAFVIITVRLSFYITNKYIFNSKEYISQRKNSEDTKSLEKKFTKISLPLLLLTPAIVQILPLTFFLSQLDFTEGSSDFAQMTLLTAIALTFSTLSIFPGAIYINEKKNGGVFHSITIILISIPTTLVVFSLLFRPIPNMIINMTMNLSGISDWRIHHFYIEEKTYPHTMFNGLLWNTRFYQGVPNRFFITGISIFTLGNTKLICPTRISYARKESLKLTIDKPNDYSEKIKKLKYSAMDCIPFNKKDVTTWDSPMSEPIYYEKLKIDSNNSMLKMLHSLK